MLSIFLSVFLLSSLAETSCHHITRNADTKPSMEYVNICKQGRDCKKFSRLVMGTDHLIQGNWVGEGQPELSQPAAFEVLDEAAKNGINFYDTSPIYVGGVEYQLGLWKAQRQNNVLFNEFYHDTSFNPDRKLYVLSKGGFPFDLTWAQHLEPGSYSHELKQSLVWQGIMQEQDWGNEWGQIPLRNVPAGTYASRLFGHPEQIVNRIAEELHHTINNLNDDIAIYLMHRDDRDAVDFKPIERSFTPVQNIMQALSNPRLSDHFWMLGWSNWYTERVNESLMLVNQNRQLPRPAINSPYFSLFEMGGPTIHALGVQATHREMMDPNFQKGIKLMPYSPLGGFSILDKPEPKWENAKRAAWKKYEEGDGYWKNVFHAIFTEANEARWYRVVEFTKEFNQRHCTDYSIDQMINAYALAHHRSDLLAVGPINQEQVRRTVRALKLAKMLSPQDLEYLYSGNRK